MKLFTCAPILLALVAGSHAAKTTSDVTADIGQHAAELPQSLVWDSPSQNALGSMPLGNGDIAANVWVEPSGDIVLLLSKTDAYDDFSRLLKLGRIRITTTPALVRAGQQFEQILLLKSGAIEIKCGAKHARVWVDANQPVIQVELQGDQPMQAEVKTEIWRTQPRALERTEGKDFESFSSYGNRPEKCRVNPDTVLHHRADQTAWCHNNTESQWQANLELTGLGAEIARNTDPILRRTFGAVVRGTGMQAVSATVLTSAAPAKSVTIQIVPLTTFADTPADWLRAAEKQADGIPGDTGKRFAAHQAWWRAYWERSWIVISSGGSLDADIVTQAYALQRFVTACAGRGALPIKFNGSLFTVDQIFDPDYRCWGGPYWFQNTRLPYWSMLYAGDYDQMLPLVKMYMNALPLRQAATKKYYGHAGAFYPETMHFWGNFADVNYGLDRQGKPDGLTDNKFIRRYWQGGLELVAMMLDYHDATQDTVFRDKTLLPMAKEIITFFDQHWKRGADGKVFYSPAQSLETWHTATNPLPEIVGLRYLLPRLLALPVDGTTKARWRKLLADQPAIPAVTKGGKTRLLPAKTYSDRCNSENPELYAVFPYRAYTLMQGSRALQTGINTWNSRKVKGNNGWRQDPIQAALLGLTDQVKELVVERARDKAVDYRFAGFYGPNMDWTPDQDQISVFQVALQRMLMQCESNRILLLPAWPKEWDCDFKLHAPQQTTVECELRDGKVVKLIVTPESRRKDVAVCAPFEVAK
jgi:hypothetical protein